MRGGFVDLPHADLLPARAPERRDHPLEAHHRPHLVRERQPGQLAPADCFDGKHPLHFCVQDFHWFDLSPSLCRASTSFKYF